MTLQSYQSDFRKVRPFEREHFGDREFKRFIPSLITDYLSKRVELTLTDGKVFYGILTRELLYEVEARLDNGDLIVFLKQSVQSIRAPAK